MIVLDALDSKRRFKKAAVQNKQARADLAEPAVEMAFDPRKQKKSVIVDETSHIQRLKIPKIYVSLQ